ncbi:hypothetical protein V5O48_012912, partial [Marasmius crinis-equi]
LMLNLNLRKPQIYSSGPLSSVGASDTLPMHYFRSADNTAKKTTRSSRGVRATKLEPEQSMIRSMDSSQKENDVAKLVGICFENCEFLGLTEILKDNRSSLDVSEPNMPMPVNIRIHTVTTTQQDDLRPERGADN